MDPVTRIRAGAQTGTDAFGQPIYGPDVEAEIGPALFAPGGATSSAASEPIDVGRTPVITAPTLYWREQWPDVVATDRLRVRGSVFAVLGVPADWRPASSTGGPGGLVVQLRDPEG